MKIRAVEAELFHAEGRTHRQTWWSILAFRNFANAPIKNVLHRNHVHPSVTWQQGKNRIFTKFNRRFSTKNCPASVSFVSPVGPVRASHTLPETGKMNFHPHSARSPTDLGDFWYKLMRNCQRLCSCWGHPDGMCRQCCGCSTTWPNIYTPHPVQ